MNVDPLLRSLFYLLFINIYIYIYIYLIILDKIIFFNKNRSDFSLQIKFSFIHKTDLNFLKKRGHIHKVNLFELVSIKCRSCVFNIPFTSCKEWYIGYQSMEDKTMSRWNRCLTPSHSITYPPSLGFLDRQISVLSFFNFGRL